MSLVRGALVLADGVRSGWVRVEGCRITQVGAGAAPTARGEEVVDAHGLVLPGLVDGHCHGALGGDFGDGGEPARRAADHHHRSGSTSLLASVLSGPHEQMVGAVHGLGPLLRDGAVDGIHLEGPFLSPARKGAHPREALRAPDLAEVESLLAAGQGGVTYVTVAPELDGAIELIAELTRRGVRVGIGHTDADHVQTERGVAAGARQATHLFNAMAPIHHRAGGPVVALMADPRVVCELVCDGHHLAADVVRWAWSVLGPKRVMLVSDASPAAGMPAGRYRLGGAGIELRDGAVWTADGGSLAGSAVTLLDSVRWCVGNGIELAVAVQAASDVPARVLGLADRGRLAPGSRADLVLVDADLRTERVMRAGAWLDAAPVAH